MFGKLPKKLNQLPDEAQADALKWRFFNEYFDGIVIVFDENARITFVNREIEGFPPEEILGAHITEWVYDKDADAFERGVREILSGGNLASLEIRGKDASDAILWYSVRLGPIKENGKTTGGMAICSDITHLKQTIEEMEDSKNAMLNLLEDIERARVISETAKGRNEAILLNMGEGLAVIDSEGILELANERLADILRVKAEDMLGEAWQNALKFKYEDNRDVPPGKTPIQQAFDFKTRVATTPTITASMRYYLSRPLDGKRIPVQVTASPVVVGGKVVRVIAVIRDVSKELELERTKTEFVSVASHQLRTPLSTVNWYTEMLLSGEIGEMNIKQKDYLNEIYAGNQRMIELVNALLNVSRLEVGAFIVEPKMVNLKDIVVEVLNENNKAIQEKRLIVNLNLDPNIPEAEADPNLVRIILQNLITNAVKYTKSKIDISMALQEGVKINPKDRTDLQGVLLKISDDGLGIPDSQKPQIFTKLFRADNARLKDPQGSGLGLYIVKSIIDQTGGEIWFDSEENKGSTFYVLAPLKWMQKRIGTRKLTES